LDKAKGMVRDASDELLWRCQRGDENALTELVHLHQDALVRLAFRVCGDKALAEEAAVAAFVTTRRPLPTISAAGMLT